MLFGKYYVVIGYKIGGKDPIGNGVEELFRSRHYLECVAFINDHINNAVYEMMTIEQYDACKQEVCDFSETYTKRMVSKI